MSDHLVESYDKQLELINSNLVKMGGLVEQQVKDSLKALDDKDTEFAEEILKKDDKLYGISKYQRKALENGGKIYLLTL